MDTRDKRASVMAMGLAALIALPLPSGSGGDAPTRLHLAGLYRGIAVGAPVVPVPPPTPPPPVSGAVTGTTRGYRASSMLGYIESLMGSMDRDTKSAMMRVFSYVLNNLRYGPLEHQARAENFQLYSLQVTTPATANQEFSVSHGLGRTPYLVLPALALDSVNCRSVELKVTRAADNQRVYLSSPSTAATMWIYVG